MYYACPDERGLQETMTLPNGPPFCNETCDELLLARAVFWETILRKIAVAFSFQGNEPGKNPNSILNSKSEEYQINKISD